MRILYVLTTLGMGGAEKLALALGERMAKRGHKVALLVLMPPVSEEWSTDLPKIYLYIRRAKLSFLPGLARARGFAGGFQPDLIHSHCFHANIFARLLRLSAPRPAVISTIHNVYEGGWPRMMAYRFTDKLSRQTVAVSEAAMQRFVELKAVPAQKCRVIANAIDTAEFAPDANRRAAMRAETGKLAEPETDFVWLATGRIAPAKDYPNLLRAFARVRASRQNARLWIAGEAPGQLLTDLKSLTADLHLTGSVRWLGLRRDVPALLDAADGFVSASAWEGMPLAVGEAMALGKPVVATNVGGVGQLVGDAGIVVPAQSAESLANAMLGVMQQSGEERCALGRAARQRIVERFGMDAAADRWEALYREWIGNAEQ
jgi:glycosyltransferase involved in cell wall biosynthesis